MLAASSVPVTRLVQWALSVINTVVSVPASRESLLERVTSVLMDTSASLMPAVKVCNNAVNLRIILSVISFQQ